MAMRDSDIKKWNNIIDNELQPALNQGLTIPEACEKIGYTKARVYHVIKQLGRAIQYTDLDGNPIKGKRVRELVEASTKAGKRTFKEVQVCKVRIL